jgi:heat shock protein HslJ
MQAIPKGEGVEDQPMIFLEITSCIGPPIVSADATKAIGPRRERAFAFAADGRVSSRIDCNRGSGTWTSSGPNQLQFGPLALTRMMCPPRSLHDQIARQWKNVRSYVIKDRHLYLSLMADGGIYEYEPITATAQPPKP